MVKVTIDTNIIISAIVFGGKPEQILKLSQDGKIKMIISPAILSEVNKVLSVKFERDNTEIIRVTKWLMGVGKIVNPARKINLIKYTPDNRILECAVEGKADYIISGDKKHLLPLGQFKNIKIVTPSQFLKTVNNL